MNMESFIYLLKIVMFDSKLSNFQRVSCYQLMVIHRWHDLSVLLVQGQAYSSCLVCIISI